MKQGREKSGRKGGLTRREFMKTSLTGAAGIAVGSSLGPSIVRAQTQKPIKLGLFGVTSGPIGMSGEASFRGVKLWAEQVNGRGGLLGRKVEVMQRDTLNKPEEAVRYAREYASSGDIDFIFAHGSSAEAFAVAAVSKDIKRLIISTPETTEYTADPKVRSPYCFRATRNCLLDNIVSGKYAAKISSDMGLTRWYTIAGDYSYGRDSVNLFVEFLKKFNPKVEVVGQAWPKLGEPDFTPHITALMGAKPQAVFSVLYAGDIVSFIKQGGMYGIFDKSKWFMKDLSEYQVINSIITALGKFPAGLYSGTRYLRIFPDTKANHDFNDAHAKLFGSRPLNWTWANYTGALLLEEAVKKAKTTENDAVIRALKDLSIKAPTGAGSDGTVTMRGRDHQLINYSMGWGVTIPEEPYLSNIFSGSWNEMIAEETAWLKNKGWL